MNGTVITNSGYVLKRDRNGKPILPKVGDTIERLPLVLDPFGGVACCALWPALHGVRWVGVELESTFVELAQANFAFWKKRWGHDPDWVEPVIVQGDSRDLAFLLRDSARLVVSSPPYAGSVIGGNDTEATARRLKALAGTGILGPRSESYAKSGKYAGNLVQPKYGDTEGQLGALPVGDLVLSSPPYEEGLGHDSGHPRLDSVEDARRAIEGSARRSGYRSGEMGSGVTFWAAARTILEQVYTVLKPGGHAIWVCKRFVRRGEIVEFPQQWAALCESVGFKLVCWHHAMLVKKGQKQKLLTGGEEDLSKSRMSFFRRLHAKKYPHLAIQWEDVMCFVKEPRNYAFNKADS